MSIKPQVGWKIDAVTQISACMITVWNVLILFDELDRNFEMVALLLCHLAFFNETRAKARMHLKNYYVWKKPYTKFAHHCKYLRKKLHHMNCRSYNSLEPWAGNSEGFRGKTSSNKSSFSRYIHGIWTQGKSIFGTGDIFAVKK